LRDATHAAERLAEIQRHLGWDPHLDYTTITTDVGAPPTPPAQGTALSVITQEGSQEVRLDAREKFPGALAQLGLEGAFVFTEDEAGRKAREELLEAQRTGTGASIESGIGIKMAKVPVGMRGVMTDEPVFGQVTLIPLEASAEPAPAPPSLVGIISAGEHEKGPSPRRSSSASRNDARPCLLPRTIFGRPVEPDVTLTTSARSCRYFSAVRQPPRASCRGLEVTPRCPAGRYGITS
jgi:hypothetical protein